MDAPTSVIADSVARKFDTSLPEGLTIELAIQLRQNRTLWHTLDPSRMERLVADLFRVNHAHAEVIHVGRPGDLGTDILYVDANKAEWLIQVKRREMPDSVEGFETLQRLLETVAKRQFGSQNEQICTDFGVLQQSLGTLVLEGKLRGIIATTAKPFSRHLVKQKHRAESRGFIIELLDRGKLDRMLSPILPKRPWLQLMNANFFWGLDEKVRAHFIESTSCPGENI